MSQSYWPNAGGGVVSVTATPPITSTAGITPVIGSTNFVGDSGAGGVKGDVPAPTAGDTAAGKFLKASGGWAVPPGVGVTSVGATLPITSSGGTTPTIAINTFTGDAGAGGLKGAVPAPAAGDAAKFLRGDATWATPGGGGGGSMILLGSMNQGQVNALSSGDFAFLGNTLSSSSGIDFGFNNFNLLPIGGTLSKLYVVSNSGQIAGGDLVVTLFVNSAPSALTITIPANTAEGQFVDLTHTVVVLAGDFISLNLANANPGFASAKIGNVALVLTI